MNTRLKILCVAGLFPVGLFAAALPKGQVPCFIPRPANVIPDSPLSENDGCPEWPPSEKKQYAPVNEELPLFVEKKSDAEYQGGAYYQDEEELYINVESDFATTSEVIEDEVTTPVISERSS